MKNLIIVFLFFFSLLAQAQQVNYKVVVDDPEIHSRLNLNLEIAQLDFSSMIDASSFNIGLWGNYEILKNRLFVETNIKKSWFALGRLGNKNYPSNFELNLGADYMFTHRIKSKKTKVNLKTVHSEKNGNNISTTTYITIPAKRMTSLGLRAGLYYKTNIYEFSNDEIIAYTKFGGKMTQAGLYAGLMRKKAINIVITDKKFGRSFTSAGSDIYIDGMLLPVKSFMDNVVTGTEERTDVTKTITNALGNSPFGFRIGYKIYQIAPKEHTGKKFGLSGTFEAGVKPYLGIFFNCGIGITIVK